MTPTVIRKQKAEIHQRKLKTQYDKAVQATQT
jgi:hypothetical protein